MRLNPHGACIGQRNVPDHLTTYANYWLRAEIDKVKIHLEVVLTFGVTPDQRTTLEEIFLCFDGLSHHLPERVG